MADFDEDAAERRQRRTERRLTRKIERGEMPLGAAKCDLCGGGGQLPLMMDDDINTMMECWECRGRGYKIIEDQDLW